MFYVFKTEEYRVKILVASAAVCSKVVNSLFLVYCCSHCLLGCCARPCSVVQHVVAFLVLQSFCWGRESWLLYFTCLTGGL